MIISILATIIGFGIISPFLKEESFFEKIALGFLLGFGLIIVPLFFFTYFHIRLNTTIVVTELLTLLSLSLLMMAIFRKKRKKSFSLQNSLTVFKRFDITQRILFFLIIALIGSSFVINYYWPVNTWDSITLYDLRAKIYFQGGLLIDLWKHVDKSVQALGYYYSYPPSTSLAHAIGYFLNDSRAMIIYSAFYSSLILLFLVNTLRKTSLTVGFFLAFVLASNSTLFYHSTIAYTNLPYATYLVAIFFAIERYIQTNRRIYFALAIFFSLWSITIRSLEPFYVIMAIPLLIHFRKKTSYIWDFILLLGSSFIYKKILEMHFTRDISEISKNLLLSQPFSVSKIINSFLDPNRVKEVLFYLYSAMQNYHYYILLLIICSIIFSKTIKKNLSPGAVITLSILVLIPGTLVLSSYYDGWNKIPDSVNRLMMFLYPLILYFVASFKDAGILLDRILNFYSRDKNTAKT